MQWKNIKLKVHTKVCRCKRLFFSNVLLVLLRVPSTQTTLTRHARAQHNGEPGTCAAREGGGGVPDLVWQETNKATLG